jgi:hypothetical protein
MSDGVAMRKLGYTGASHYFSLLHPPFTENQHYGFTHEDLDFIINYDIKYRMGKELDIGEEDSND